MADHTFRLSTGRTLGYAEYGDPRGTPLFYFHGWPSCRLQGELLDETAKARGLRVIAADRPGIGLSELQPGRRLCDWPPIVAELAARAGADKFYVMGVSGGGPYALACAQAMPERLLGAAVVCGAPALGEVGTEGLFWAYKLGLWAQRRLPIFLRPGLRLAGWITTREYHQWPQTWLSALYAPADRSALKNPRLHHIMMRSGHEALMGDVASIRHDGMIYSSDWGFDLGSIRYPVRFWHGDEDWNIPLTLAQKTAARIPGAIFKVMPRDGHYSLPLLRGDEIVGELLQAAAATR